MISPLQRAFGGLAPPLLAVHIAFAGQAPLAVDVQQPSGGAIRQLRKNIQADLLARQQTIKAPEPVRISEPQFARTTLDQLLAKLLSPTYPQVAPSVPTIQIPIAPWVFEPAPVFTTEPHSSIIGKPLVAKATKVQVAKPAVVPVVVAKEPIAPVLETVAPVAAVLPIEQLLEPEGLSAELLAEIDVTLQASDTDQEAMRLKVQRNQQMALLAALLLFEQQE